MKNTANQTIVLLSITAAILGAVAVGSYTSDKAYADASVKQGDYSMVTFVVSPARDMLCVVDIAARRMNTYLCNVQRMTIDLWDSVDLDRSFR